MKDLKKTSVLGGARRVRGNVPAADAFDTESVKPVMKRPKGAKKASASSKGNQSHQLKVSETVKEEIQAIKFITNIRFDYEVVDLLIDTYVASLSEADRRRFKAMIKE